MKKILAMTLAVMLVLSMGVVAFADGNVAKISDQEYPTLAAAVAAAQEGDVVELISNTTILDGTTIVVNKNITIDGKNYSIDCSYADAADGTWDYDPTIRIETGATIKNINFTGLVKGAKDNSPIYIAGNGTADKPIVIDGCTFTGGSEASLVAGIISEGGAGDYLTVKNCKFTNVKYAAYFNGLDNAKIQNNTVDGTQYNAFVVEDGTAVFSNNTLKNIATKDFSDPYNYGIYSGAAATVTVDGGSIAMAGEKAAVGKHESGTLSVNGGMFSSDPTAFVAGNVVIAALDTLTPIYAVNAGNVKELSKQAGDDRIIITQAPENAEIAVEPGTKVTNLSNKKITVNGVAIAADDTDGTLVAPDPNQKDPCNHDFDDKGECKDCHIVVVDYVNGKPAAEEESNPNTGASLCGVAAILGALSAAK